MRLLDSRHIYIYIYIYIYVEKINKINHLKKNNIVVSILYNLEEKPV